MYKRKHSDRECKQRSHAAETSAEREERRKKHAAVQRKSRTVETAEESKERRKRHAAEQRKSLTVGTSEEREEKRKRHAAVQRTSLKAETTEEREERRKRHAAVQRKSREKESNEQIQQRRQNNAKTTKRHREVESAKNVKRRRIIDRKRLKIKREENKKESVTEATNNFLNALRRGPTYVCVLCHRLMFVSSVRKFQTKRMAASFCKLPDDIRKRISDSKYLSNGPEYVCYTCSTAVQRGRLPAQAKANNLVLNHAPDELVSLSSLEKQLISTRIPFMKIVNLPRGKQRSLHGPVVNVPAKFDKVCSLLPRIPQSAGLIRVKLKRQLKYKGHFMHELVRPERVRGALTWLKANNPLYSEVKINDDWLSAWEANDSELWQAMTCEEVAESAERDQSMEVQQNVVSEQLTTTEDSGVEHVPANIDQESQQTSETEDVRVELEDQAAAYRDSTVRGLPYDSCFHINNIEAHTINIAPAEGESPLPIFDDSKFEEGCNPDKYPYGTGGLSEKRPVKLTAKKYFIQRLLDADGRFARDPQYLHIAQYACESKNIQDQIRIAFRKMNSKQGGQKVTAAILKDSQRVNDLVRKEQALKFLKNVRGSPMYWQTVMYDVLAMIRQLGCPTWFISLSAADLHWPELITMIAIQTGKHLTEDDVGNLSWEEKCEILRQNPVTAARQFNYRIDKFFSLFLKSSSNPLGKLKEYFIRIEFQARGSPHAHALLWIDDAPQLNTNTDEEVSAFIDNYITCSAKPQDPELESIIQVQHHHHSSSCRRGKRNECRFDYPHLPSPQTLITRPPDNLELIKPICEQAARLLSKIKDIIRSDMTFGSLNEMLEKAGVLLESYVNALKVRPKTSVIMRRDMNDIWTNNYNESVMRAWRGNMDIQYITDVYACVSYIVSYACKAEQSMSELLKKVAEEWKNEALRTQMKKVAATFLNHQEVSAQEAAYRLLSLYLKKMSRKVLYIDTNKKGDRVLLCKPVSEIMEMKDDDENLFLTSIHDKYSARPETLENMCLAEFATTYTSIHNSRHLPDHLHEDSDDEDETSNERGSIIKLQNNLGFLCKRQKMAVLRYHRFRQDKEEEKFYFSKLLLYLPWRDEESELSAVGSESYSDKYISNRETVDQNEAKFNLCHMDSALNLLDIDNVEGMWDDIAPGALQEEYDCNMQQPTVECNIEQSDVNANRRMIEGDQSERSFIIDQQPAEMPLDEYMSLMNSLNDEQKAVVDQVSDWCGKVVNKQHVNSTDVTDDEINPFYYFISGPGGVGKSHVIKAVYETCRKQLKPLHTNSPDAPTVLLMAPTGCAAFQIGGKTLHSTLHLNTHSNYQPLSSEKQNYLHNMYEHLRVVIIDEISMVGSQTLYDVHRRLKEIMGRSDYDDSIFGGVSILAVGDLFQLQPVRQKYVFERPSDLYAALYGCLWDNFTLFELKQIVRQKENNFAQLLNRVRTASCTSDDIQQLQDRLIEPASQHQYSDILHVFSTNEMTDNHNDEMLDKLPPPHYCLVAIDAKKDIHTGQIDITMPKKASETGGLKERIHIAKGCRIMLVANLDVSDGLVNGARGEIADFRFKDGQITTLLVKFDRNDVGRHTAERHNTGNCVPIDRHEAKFSVGRHRSIEVTRRQFPVTLAWASTVHKVQGLTVDKIVISFRGHFGPGQAYVALSRVKCMSGLHLLDFESKKITCNSKVTKHMDTMRNKKQDFNASIQMNKQVTQRDDQSEKSQKRIKDVLLISSETQHKSLTNFDTQLAGTVTDVFANCKVNSIDNNFQKQLQHELNLQQHTMHTPADDRHSSLKQLLQTLIFNSTHIETTVIVHPVQGDGNCLFRALSSAITGSELQHNIIRSYVVNHMLSDRALRQMLDSQDSSAVSYEDYLHRMQTDGEWGTDKEIIAAAHLFQCSIVCLTRYNNTTKLCLQHFPPHFATSQTCTNICKHETLYLINNTGTHYNLATVLINDIEE